MKFTYLVKLKSNLMSVNNFEEYKTFGNLEQVKEITDLLKQNKIQYKVEKITPLLDPVFGGNTQHEHFVIKLKNSDFERADKVIANDIDINPEELVSDYYLFQFTDDELMDVIVKKDEWTDFDNKLAQKLLSERGIEISPDELETIRSQRLADLSQHKPFPKTLIIAGYILAFFGGLISIFIALQFLLDRKNLPDGSKMYNYDPNARSHGLVILIIGTFVFIIILIFKLKGEFNNVFEV